MSLTPKQYVAALNETSETALKALEFARASRERADKVAEMFAAFPVPTNGRDGLPGPPGADGKSIDPAQVEQTIREMVGKIPAPAAGPAGPQGPAGKDADQTALEARVDTQFAALTPKALETARMAALEAVPDIVKTELAAAVSALPTPRDGQDGKDGDCACLADAWKGNWSKETTYQRGDLFGFRGASYVVLRECRGVIPSVASQKGPNPYYAVLAAAGAPGIANITQGPSGGGSGTVTSVALTAPSIFSVGGSPVTTDGTLALTLATQAANLVWAGPTNGAAATPTFRSLVAADIPDLLAIYDEAGAATDALALAVAYTDGEIEDLAAVYQPLNSDLTAIAGLVGTGYARKTGVGAWTLDTTIPTSRGGTGLTSYAAGDLIYGNISGTLSKLPEPGLPGYVLGSVIGQPTWQQLSTLTATTITGTANQVLVNGTSGSGQTGPVTLTLPQSIGTASTPQFERIGIGQAASGTVPFSITTAAGAYAIYNTTNANGAFVVFQNSATGIGDIGSFKAVTGGGNAGDFFVSSRAGDLILGTGDTRRLTIDSNGFAQFISTGGSVATFDSSAAAGSFVIWRNGGSSYGDIGSELAITGGGSMANFMVTSRGGNLLLGTSDTVRAIMTATLFNFSAGSIQTAAPSGGTAQPWKLGNYTAGAAAQAGKVRVEINGTPYDLLTA